jgi:hypothetical protein
MTAARLYLAPWHGFYPPSEAVHLHQFSDCSFLPAQRRQCEGSSKRPVLSTDVVNPALAHAVFAPRQYYRGIPTFTRIDLGYLDSRSLLYLTVLQVLRCRHTVSTRSRGVAHATNVQIAGLGAFLHPRHTSNLDIRRMLGTCITCIRSIYIQLSLRLQPLGSALEHSSNLLYSVYRWPLQREMIQVPHSTISAIYSTLALLLRPTLRDAYPRHISRIILWG